MQIDCLIVGSGCSGAQAAQTLVEAGQRVLMLDVGNCDEAYDALVPEGNFSEIRRTDPKQHQYFLGNQFEGVPVGQERVGSQLTPPRQFITQDASRFGSFASNTFSPMQSFAYGGLGAGWGLGCNVYSSQELKEIGFESDLLLEYEKVAMRIGISCGSDDASPYSIGNLKNLLPPLRMDTNAEVIHRAYSRKKKKLNRSGFYLGQPPLALLSRDFKGRRSTPYSDMDFWKNEGYSAYRPSVTIEELKRNDNFTYLRGHLVLSYKETDDGVELEYMLTQDGTRGTCSAKKLLLTAGALGTARIVLRSNAAYSRRLPLLCNPYFYVPCLNLGMFFKRSEDQRTSMAQLALFYDSTQTNCGSIMTVLYSYRSLLLYKLMKEIPLGFRQSRFLMQHLQSALTIAAINHPDTPHEEKSISLEKDEASVVCDRLDISYVVNPEQQSIMKFKNRKILKALVRLGCIPLKKMGLPPGASIHYAGTLPFSKTPQPFTTDLTGRLHGTKNVYIADGSPFKYLPAKGITFTLMANAHRVAQHVSETQQC